MKKNIPFRELGVSDKIIAALEKKGYQYPTQIQIEVIPHYLKDRLDIIGQARTGTGKTAAFGIPLLELCKENSQFVEALILTPTRELAMQVAKEIESLKGNLKTRITSIYGGQKISPQIKTLKEGVDIIVGTPGRILDHIRAGRLNLSKINHLILDEADEMLDMGFQEELEAILKNLNKNRRTLLFSATMPARVKKIAEQYMGKTISVKVKATNEELSKVSLIAYEISAKNKLNALCRILDYNDDFYGLVFCRTRSDVDNVSRELQNRNYLAEGFHGDMSQAIREKVLQKFRDKKIRALVATDVAARGIDINDLQFVINYAVPDTAEALTHRIGRTARAGKSGAAISIVSPSEYMRFKKFEKENNMIHKREDLPGKEEIIKNRIENLQQRILKKLSEEISENYQSIAKKLLSLSTPEAVVTALLSEFQGNVFEPKYIEEILNVKDTKKYKTSKNNKFSTEKNRKMKRSGKRKKNNQKR